MDKLCYKKKKRSYKYMVESFEPYKIAYFDCPEINTPLKKRGA